MKNKPLYLKLFPLLAFGIAISFPLQIYFLYDIPLQNVKSIFSMLTPLNIISMIAFFTISLLTLTLSKQIYKVIPALLFLLFANNAIVGLYGTDYSLIQVGLSFIAFGISLKPFYNREIRAIILNPQLRWWNTPARYEVMKPLQLHSDTFEMNSKTLNISTTGVFAEVKDLEKIENFQLNQVIDVKMIGSNAFKLKAKIVRKTLGDENMPSGFGLEFVRDRTHKKEYIPWLKKAVL